MSAVSWHAIAFTIFSLALQVSSRHYDTHYDDGEEVEYQPQVQYNSPPVNYYQSQVQYNAAPAPPPPPPPPPAPVIINPAPVVDSKPIIVKITPPSIVVTKPTLKPLRTRVVVVSNNMVPVPIECYQSSDPGSCGKDMVRIYYDHETRTCHPFSYTGCGGNANRFMSVKNCYRICHPYRYQQKPIVANVRSQSQIVGQQSQQLNSPIAPPPPPTVHRDIHYEGPAEGAPPQGYQYQTGPRYKKK